MRSIARRLIAHETLKHDPFGTTHPASFQVTERLRPHLATLMGNGGFRALLARALVLASEEVPWLRDIQVSGEGSLQGLTTPHPRLKPAEIREGQIVLLAQLLGLLVAFIGPGLTLGLLGEIWPELAGDDADFGNGDEA
jgi:hypothetical protein